MRILFSTLILVLLHPTIFAQQVNLTQREKSNIYPIFDSCVGAEFEDYCTELKLKEYIEENLIYPPSEFKRNELVKVLVLFAIEKDGSVRSGQVTISVNDVFDNEALRVIKSIPHFLPVMKDGVPVRHKVSYYVEFSPPEKRRKKKEKKKKMEKKKR